MLPLPKIGSVQCTFGSFEPEQLHLVAFDLDGTLVESKQKLDPAMAQALQELLSRFDVAIISGAKFAQFTSQILDWLQLPADAHPLHLLPTCGSQYYRLTPNSISEVYVKNLDAALLQRAVNLVEETARQMGLWHDNPWGEIIENRGTQVTFSALGQQAPGDAKAAWDPSGEKRQSLAAALAVKLPQLQVKVGGSTSIDITAKGIDKAFGMRALMKHLGLMPREVVFLGDRFDEYGNDRVVLETDIAAQCVTGWRQTAEFIDDLLRLESGGV